MKMSIFVYILIFIVANCDSSSIRIKQNVTKREVDGNFFPNWVPFKNKHGDELGEFIDVNKPKPKKRLALPVNYVLKAVASESDDYYDKSQGGDGEDYYEKKDWSDLHRPAQDVDVKINPSNISDIDGIVNIITKPSISPILKALSGRLKTSRKNVKEKSKRQNIDKDLEVKKLEDVNINVENQSRNVRNEENNEDEEKDEELTTDNKKENIEESDEEIENESKEKVEKPKSDKKDEITDKEKEYTDDEEDSTEKQKEEEAKAEEQRKNEEKKAKILSSVDELKERHAKEQQRISEKVKEEEMLKDELDREFERSGNKKHDDYDKYTHTNSKWRLTEDIDSSEEDEEPVYKNKYEIHPYRRTTTSTTAISTTLPPKKRTTQKRKKDKTVATAKVSVFRNPNLYTINDEEYGTATVKPSKPKIQTPRKFSSRYSAADKDNVHISLVPANDSKEDEPTLFYPKKRRIMRKPKTTTPIPDTTADSSQETSSLTETRISSDMSEINPSGPTGTGPSDTYISASNTAPSGDIAPETTASDSSDSTQASSSKKEDVKEGDYHREKGGGKETSEEHEEKHEEHGKKAYEGVHKEAKTKKGHHDKEDVLDKYDDHGVLDKQHHKEDNHFGSHRHEEHGKKHAKYEESGKHSKGHSTKGSHDIHKKDEYEKKVEFFEEEGDSDDEEHDGGYHKEKEHHSGGQFKKGSLDAAHAGHLKGATEHFVKGGHGNHHKAHKASEGKDFHGRHSGSHHKFEGHGGGKKWVYHHGHPARNANLVIIDRRADAYQHGPLYYG